MVIISSQKYTLWVYKSWFQSVQLHYFWWLYNIVISLVLYIQCLLYNIVDFHENTKSFLLVNVLKSA